jgi:hypothetical protein
LGIDGVERLFRMRDVMQGRDGDGVGEGEVVLRGVYPGQEQVDMFWAAMTEARQVLMEARDRGHTGEEGEFREEVRAVRY